MTAPTAAEQIKADQLAASIAAKLPISLAFDAIEAEFKALLQRSATAPVVPVVEKAE